MTHFNGMTDSEMREALADAQAFNPRNVDDAWYAVCHPSEYDSQTLAICQRTVDSSPLYGNTPVASR